MVEQGSDHQPAVSSPGWQWSSKPWEMRTQSTDGAIARRAACPSSTWCGLRSGGLRIDGDALQPRTVLINQSVNRTFFLPWISAGTPKSSVYITGSTSRFRPAACRFGMRVVEVSQWSGGAAGPSTRMHHHPICRESRHTATPPPTIHTARTCQSQLLLSRKVSRMSPVGATGYTFRGAAAMYACVCGDGCGICGKELAALSA